jgi:hypothetical protein
MDQFWVQGVVKNGQVVLDTALDLPDGTVVTVMNYDPDDDPRPVGPGEPLAPDVIRNIMIGLTGRTDLRDDPEWEAKIGRPR